MKKIGLGIQELSKFKKRNLIYVDKTEMIHQLIQEGEYYFLSRPRRFGKSLLVNTFKELFEGNRELFEECWIYDQWDWEDRYQVITISFANIDYEVKGLEAALDAHMMKLGKRFDIAFEESTYSGKFGELIEKLGKEKPVVILIDEYDKPIVNHLEEKEGSIAEENRKILRAFYSCIKDSDRYIRFLFLTGVSKFGKVSLFSDLNHLADISVTDEAAKLLGYTESELTAYYGEYLQQVAEIFKLSQAELIEKMRQWYDGYSWDGRNFMYNPFSILSFLRFKSFDNYWFETGSPTFLINELKKPGNRINASINKKVSKMVFNKYDIDNIDPTSLMFQTGYLTIKDYKLQENKFILDFPNKEVRESFLLFASRHYAKSSYEEMEYTVDTLVNALKNDDMQSFFIALKSLFSSIAVKQLDKVKEYEGYYHSIIYIVLKLVGIQIACEIQSSFGVTDAIIKTDETIFVIEFKMGTAQMAMDQIKQKKYCDPYQADKRKIIMVGIGIDKEEKNLTDVLAEPDSH